MGDLAGSGAAAVGESPFLGRPWERETSGSLDGDPPRGTRERFKFF
jgi:hypothetical protein